MKLSNSSVGKVYKITSVIGEEKIRRRLLVLGILKNTNILILNKKINGALIIKVRGTRIGISKKVADLIQVKEERYARAKASIYRKS